MVAYSFKRRFVGPIRWGLGLGLNISDADAKIGRPKRHTIRADRKRHARPGEELQLYTAMRTKQCELIGRARCTDVRPIILTFDLPACVAVHDKASYAGKGLDEFARSDGFNNWADLIGFWHAEHPAEFAAGTFVGVIIFWEPLERAP